MNLTIERLYQLGQPIIEQRQTFMAHCFRIDDRRHVLVGALEIVVDHHVLIPTDFPKLLAR